MEKNSDKKSFNLFTDYKEVFDDLTDEQAGQIIKAIFAHETGEECQLAGLMNAVFTPIRQQLDRNRESYAEKCAKNRENGKTGGRPKNQTDNDETQNNRTVIFENPTKAKKPDTDTDTDTDKETDTDKDLDRETSSSTTGVRADELAHLVRHFAEAFGDTTFDDHDELAALRDEFGYLCVWSAIMKAADRSPPPKSPIGYVGAVAKEIGVINSVGLRLAGTG